MDIFDVLSLIGVLCLFLFGMNLMGDALERSAGSKLEIMIGKLTSGKLAGLLTGLGVTAVIQSSSATTVMVVGFVNSRLMNLKQAIHVIMGANIGTTVTAWILSLSGISGSNMFLKLLKPSSFTPVLALIGIVLFMFTKSNKKKDIGMVLLGFATLMFGMETMTGAVSGLRDVPAFGELFIMFKNPILGVIAGAILTAIIQSSSASVGILQALAATGAVSYGAAIPIIMGQNTQVTTAKSIARSCEDIDETVLTAAQFKAIATDNPQLLEKMELENRVSELRILQRNYQDEQADLEYKINKYFPDSIKNMKWWYEKDLADVELLKKTKGQDFSIILDGKLYAERVKAGQMLNALFNIFKENEEMTTLNIGEFRGLKLQFRKAQNAFSGRVYIIGNNEYNCVLSDSDIGSITRLENTIDKIEKELLPKKQEIEKLEKQLETAKNEYGQPFIYEAELSEKSARLTEIDTELELGKANEDVILDDEESENNDSSEYEPVTVSVGEEV